MTRSADPDLDQNGGLDHGIGDLPPALPAMWRLLTLGARHERRLLALSLALALTRALPDSLVAVWLMLLAHGLVAGDDRLVWIAGAGLAVSAPASWLLTVTADRVSRRFRARMTVILEALVARLQATTATVVLQERQEYLDRLAVLRDEVFVLGHVYTSLLSFLSWGVRLGVTVTLLVSVHPALILLMLAAAPAVVTSLWRPGVEHAAQERGAAARRLARHLYVTVASAGPAKEVRIHGLGPRLVAARRRAWQQSHALTSRARWASAAWHTGAWAVFGAAYAWAVVSTVGVFGSSPGEVLLVAAAGAGMSGYVGAAVNEVGYLRGIWLDGAQRLAWLENHAQTQARDGSQPPPERLRSGIVFDRVRFTYPGRSEPALDEVSFHVSAGGVLALVGDNGAGKSTIAKLLTRLYEPNGGRICVDDVDLADLEVDAWRERVAAAFQDFCRFELIAQLSIGVGDLSRAHDGAAVREAAALGGAKDLLESLPEGLRTQLGAGWDGGVEPSFGQWQRVALSRGLMRLEPLLLILDEPTASLDPHAEEEVFRSYTEAARRRGITTMLVSHRLGTVRMADVIVVLRQGRVVELGNHADLMQRKGYYAELFGIQQAAYS